MSIGIRGSVKAPEPTSGAETEVLRKRLGEFKKRLGEKECLIFDNRVIAEDPLTLKEIEKRFDASRESMRQKQGKISRRL